MKIFHAPLKIKNLLSCIYAVDRDCLTVMVDGIYKESYTSKASEKKKRASYV